MKQTWDSTINQISGVVHIGPLRQEPQRFVVADQSADGSYEIRVELLRSSETVGQVAYLALVNRKTNLELSPSDVGVGYSQMLPLIAQSALAREQLVCIEQPELHLHPAMQARLGEMFVNEATGGNRVRFLIETHSESLMLRILRKIRQGDIPADDVLVCYVDQDEAGSSVIYELPIDERGNFMSPWPRGFFDERLEELSF